MNGNALTNGATTTGKVVSFASRGDQYKLVGTFYKGTTTSSKSTRTKSAASILISSATAVKQTFYRHLATHLANEGYNVLTYDYRGIGDSCQSLKSSLRGFDDMTMSDWALKDMPGALDYLLLQQSKTQTTAGTDERHRLYMFGHSIGGQIAGLLPEDLSNKVNGMITVSSQSGYWKLQGDEQKYVVCFHVHVTLPLLANVVGYMPWSWFTNGAQDLPKNAAIQWSKWCRQPNYILDDTSLPLHRYKSFNCPILAYSIEDDKWGTSNSVDKMMLSAYPNVERRHLHPKENPASEGDAIQSIGHFGYFREESYPLWTDAVEWLNDQNNN